MTAYATALPLYQFFDANGPLVGGKVYFYQAGTSTPQAAYTDAGATTPCANPLILDANGQGTFWLKSGLTYKINLTDSASVQQPNWPQDGIVADPAQAVFDAFSASSGASLIGYTQGDAGSISRNLQGKVQEIKSVLDFGAVANGGQDSPSVSANTAAIQAALNWLSGNSTVVPADRELVFPPGTYYVNNLSLSNTSRCSIHFREATLFGMATSAQAALLSLTNLVDTNIYGSGVIHGNDNSNYACGISLQAAAGGMAATTRVSIAGLTFMRLKVAIIQGAYNNDIQNSEVVWSRCVTICPIGFWGAGSQTGSTLVGCNLIGTRLAAFPSDVINCIKLEGGFWSMVGGEIENTGVTAQDIAINMLPCADSAPSHYGNLYPSLRCSNINIETPSYLLLLSNPRALTPTKSNMSAISFENCGGYIPTGPINVIDTTNDDTYAGKLYFNNGCNFYDGYGSARANAHIILGANTVLDLDGDVFTASFKPGLSGISTAKLGKPKLRGETIAPLYGSTTSIAATETLVQFGSIYTTKNSTVGAALYGAGVFTASQDLYDVDVSWQLQLASAAAAWDTYVKLNSSVLGYGTRISSMISVGSIRIPFVAAGQTIKLYAITYTSAIALTGGAFNFMNISART